MKTKIIVILLLLWFQFGADLFERYQFNLCEERIGKDFHGMSFSPLLLLPGDFALLNIMISEDNCGQVRNEKK